MNHNSKNDITAAAVAATSALKHDSLRDAHCRLNAKIIRNANSLNAMPISANHGSNIRKTNEWADSILKDLDNLILSNQRYTASLSNPINIASNQTTSTSTTFTDHVATATATGPPKSPQKRSTIINVVLRKTTPSSSPTSPTAPTAFASTPTNLNKNQTAIITATTTAAAKDNNKIQKPEKHVSGFGFSLLVWTFFFCSSCGCFFFKNVVCVCYFFHYWIFSQYLCDHSFFRANRYLVICFRHLAANPFDHISPLSPLSRVCVCVARATLWHRQFCTYENFVYVPTSQQQNRKKNFRSIFTNMYRTH